MNPVTSPPDHPPIEGARWIEYRQAHRDPGTNAFAVASFVIGVVGVFVFFLPNILAAVFGHVALNQIKTSGASGKGLAIAGLVLGWIGVALWSLVGVLVLIGLASGA
jgi:Domain of unknown function (DUF4190)